MGDTELSWQGWGENARLWVAGVEPICQAQVFTKHLLSTELYVMCGRGFKRPQKNHSGAEGKGELE